MPAIEFRPALRRARPFPEDPRFRVYPDGTILGVRGRPLTPYPIGKKGYLTVQMGAGKRRLVSRVVALTFLGKPKRGQTDCAHRDGNHLENNWRNLRWSTRAQNEADKIIHGRANRGERHGMSRITEEKVLEIRRMIDRKASGRGIAKAMGVPESLVSKIKHGKLWSHL